MLKDLISHWTKLATTTISVFDRKWGKKYVKDTVETILEINFLSQDFSPERHFWEPNMRIHMYIKALFCLNDDDYLLKIYL